MWLRIMMVASLKCIIYQYEWFSWVMATSKTDVFVHLHQQARLYVSPPYMKPLLCHPLYTILPLRTCPENFQQCEYVREEASNSLMVALLLDQSQFISREVSDYWLKSSCISLLLIEQSVKLDTDGGVFPVSMIFSKVQPKCSKPIKVRLKTIHWLYFAKSLTFQCFYPRSMGIILQRPWRSTSWMCGRFTWNQGTKSINYVHQQSPTLTSDSVLLSRVHNKT